MTPHAVFQVLADPTRLHLVEALFAGEMTVGDLVKRVEIQQSGVSRHLRILGESGFVRVRPEGTKRFYSLRPEPLDELQAWVTRYRALFQERLDRFGHALQQRQKGNN